MRQSVCDGLKALGVEIDYDLNNRTHNEAIISSEASRIKVMVVPTTEELMMAKDTYRLVSKQ
jgi:acetate kinase